MRALITGITGQDGSHLTGFLLSKGRVISDESLRAGLVERGQLRVMWLGRDAMAGAVYEAYLRTV